MSFTTEEGWRAFGVDSAFAAVPEAATWIAGLASCEKLGADGRCATDRVWWVREQFQRRQWRHWFTMGFAILPNVTNAAFIAHLRSNHRDKTAFAAAMTLFYVGLNAIRSPRIPAPADGDRFFVPENLTIVKRTFTITLLRYEQPSQNAWRELCRLVGRWNQRHSAGFTPVMELMWLVNFDEASRGSMGELLEQLDKLRAKVQAHYHFAWRTHLEEDDYSKADFLELLGADLPESEDSFIANLATAFQPATPCPECGSCDAFDMLQVEPLRIDRVKLERAMQDAAGGTEQRYDVVNLPHGGKLVSKRLASVLRASGAVGYDLPEVVDAGSGSPSLDLFQVAAHRVVLAPCPEHSRIDGEPHCPRCGTARGMLEDYFWIQQAWLGEDEVLSGHPNKAAMLYVSRRVYSLLEEKDFPGLSRNDALFVCPHGP